MFPRERQASPPPQAGDAAGPALCGDSVSPPWARHRCGLQGNQHLFFQQMGGNFSGRALTLDGSCLALLCAGSSRLKMVGSSTGRMGTDVKEHEMWPGGIRVHHKVPDVLHPQLVPTTPRVLLWPAQPPRASWKNWGPKVPSWHKAQPVAQGKLVPPCPALQ